MESRAFHTPFNIYPCVAYFDDIIMIPIKNFSYTPAQTIYIYICISGLLVFGETARHAKFVYTHVYIRIYSHEKDLMDYFNMVYIVKDVLKKDPKIFSKLLA